MRKKSVFWRDFGLIIDFDRQDDFRSDQREIFLQFPTENPRKRISSPISCKVDELKTVGIRRQPIKMFNFFDIWSLFQAQN